MLAGGCVIKDEFKKLLYPTTEYTARYFVAFAVLRCGVLVEFSVLLYANFSVF